MKVITIVGIVLIAAGAFLVFRGASFTSREEVLDVGPLTVTAEERRPISPWIGAVVLLGGVALVIQGVRRKS
jgi:uncharacterized membrane protein